MVKLGFFVGQNDDPSGPNIDPTSGSIQEKKIEMDKRGMGMTDYNGDMRKGGRGGGGGVSYRSPGSKEAAPGDAGAYYDKVMPHYHVYSLCISRLSCLDNMLSFIIIFSSCDSTFSSCLFHLPHFSFPQTSPTP